MNAGRIMVNTPSVHGAIGGIFNNLHPSFTLGCGSGGKNITTENVTAHHLINIQRVCRPRKNEKWFSFNHENFLNESYGYEKFQKEYFKNF
jgi:acetaldehyde dehydrogenase/alcohol dehydrogenase